MSYFNIYISRHYQDQNQTNGVCYVINKESVPVFTSLSLERGWRNNEKNISCIPVGEYRLEKEYSSKFKTNLWEIKGVENRSECKFHSANFWGQLNGCIALGNKFVDINNDDDLDVVNSKKSLKLFSIYFISFI